MNFITQFVQKQWQRQAQIQAEQDRLYEQSQAIVEWMYLILLADQQIGLSSRDYVQARIAELPWRPNQSMDAFVSRTVAKTREAIQNRGILKDLVVSMGDRIHTLGLQEVAREHLESIVRGKGRSDSWVLGELERAL
jgi:hypothetical protein